MSYKRSDCVVVVTGEAWPEDNSRQRGAPEDIGENAVAYIDTRRQANSLVFVIGKRRLYWVRNDHIQPLDPVRTGDGYNTKICLTCGILKPTEDFEYNQTRSDGTRVRRPRCRTCFRLDSGRSMPNSVRDAYLAQHGPAQGDLWQCPLCKKFSVAGVNVRITVDHDQQTGTPRGLICDSCNTGLGRFKNGEDHLANAIDYLNNWESRQGN